MEITKEEAKDTLEQIQNIVSETRKSIASKYTSPLLIMWGLIWIACYVVTHILVVFQYYAFIWHLWSILCGFGVIATFVICRYQYKRGHPTRISKEKKDGLKMFLFWTLLYAYGFTWLFMFQPKNGIEYNAFLCTVIMFAFIVMGLWYSENYMVFLGLAVTATTLLGFYLIPPFYYNLWMAPTAGGGLLGTGLYLRFRWR
jgi:hypothetical protein